MSTARVKNFTVTYVQEEEFADLKKEIFGAQIYYFATQQSQPIIIDAGAHIGVASLYFKWLYPEAKILAFEPNPILANLYRENLTNNHLVNWQLEEVALGKHQGQQPFYYDGTSWQWYSVGSLKKGAWNGKQLAQQMTMVTVKRLCDYCSVLPRIDLLKMDIEGSEFAVLLSLKSYLPRIKNIIFEWHSAATNTKLNECRSFLEKSGYKVEWKNRTGKKLSCFHHQELILVEASR